MTREEAMEIITNVLQSDESNYTKKIDEALAVAQKALEQEPCQDAISRQAALNIRFSNGINENGVLYIPFRDFTDGLKALPSAQPEIIRCKDCKYWRRQTNYVGAPLSFGFCESDDMWRSLYGETTEVAHIDTDDNHYCGYAERREE